MRQQLDVEPRAMDRKVQERKSVGNCFKVVRCTGSKHSLMLRALKGVACQSGTCRNQLCFKRKHKFNVIAVPLLHHPCNHGPFSPVDTRPKSDTSPCYSSFCMVCKMKGLYINPIAKLDAAVVGSLEDSLEQTRFEGVSSVDGLSSSEALSCSIGDSSFDHGQIEDTASSSDGSSPMIWPLNRNEKHFSGTLLRGLKPTMSSDHVAWDEKNEKGVTGRLETEMMKQRFAKLLLGEDMSGGGKGACTALAISNAITNLSASVFSELWRLEPLSWQRKEKWHREMEWLLSVADYIVELVPSWQSYANDSVEVMATRPRSDLHMNLPALRKLDTMLVECLDSFNETEFWYVDQDIFLAEDEHVEKHSLPRQEERWWLPTPKVPLDGLSNEARKKLKHQRDSINQILKAAMVINSQILSEMNVPDAYWQALPRSGKASLGETIYRHIASEYFSPDALLSSLDLNSEHDALELVNRIEAAIYLWRRNKMHKQTVASEKDSKLIAKSSWSIVKELMIDLDRRELFAERSECLLLYLKQQYPELPQTLLDILKIQYNTDVGQSILESYSRVLESLAFNIMALIDDILHVDELTKHAPTPAIQVQKVLLEQKPDLSAPFTTPHSTPTSSPTHSCNTQKVSNSSFLGEYNPQGMVNLLYHS